MEELLQTQTLVIILLLVVSLVAIAVRRLRLPYTVALVLVGLAIAFLQPVAVEVTPELILALLIPPLVFEAAFQVDFALLRANLVPILAMAVPGVLLTTFIVGGIVTVLDFLVVSLGGLAIGLILGWMVAQVIARIDDPLIEVTLTTVLAFGAYLAAERIHVSGVLAVVAAGLVSGNVGLRGMSPSTKIMLENFWEYVAFLANSLVFLLIGLRVNVPLLLADLWPIAVAVLAVLIARAVAVYGLSWLAYRLGSRVPKNWRHVFFWGGLRGAIALALALGLPGALADREMLLAMTFGVVLFTLLAQGTTIQFLLRRLGLVGASEGHLEREIRWGRLYMTQAGQRRLLALNTEGLLTGDIWAGISEEYRLTNQQLTADVDLLYAQYPELEREVVLQTRREALKAERSALRDALVRGWLSGQVHHTLAQEVDRRLEAVRLIEETAFGSQASTADANSGELNSGMRI